MSFRTSAIPMPAPSRAGLPYRKFGQRGGTGGRRKHKPGHMNGTERKYADHLETLCRAGDVSWFAFESTTFKLAEDTRYTPDFTVMLRDGSIEFHEVKGTTKNKATGGKKPFIEPAAKIKIKVAAELLPFRFSIFYLVAGQWQRQNFWEDDGAALSAPAISLPANIAGLFQETFK